MYRILTEHTEVRERRNQLRHPNYQKPELLATGANQLWSWDITVLEAQPDVGLVYTNYQDMDESGQVLGYGKRCRIPYSKERMLLDFMTFHFRLIRRSVFEQVGGIVESLSDLLPERSSPELLYLDLDLPR